MAKNQLFFLDYSGNSKSDISNCAVRNFATMQPKQVLRSTFRKLFESRAINKRELRGMFGNFKDRKPT